MSFHRVRGQLFRGGLSLRFVLLVATSFPATAWPAPITMVNNGPSANRVDVVFLGDGYTTSDLNTSYVGDINAMVNYMFGQDPFARYSKFFNIHRIDIASNERGADIPPLNVFRDTALDASYFTGDIDRLLYVNESKANDALATGLAGASFDAEMRLVTVNDSRYGGGGGRYAVYAGGNSSATEIALHELGHSFSQLADEYSYGGPERYTGPEPGNVNLTTDPTGAKWARWLGHSEPDLGTVGAYEGAGYSEFGLFRPSEDSKMRDLGRPFDAIAREKFVLDIYGLVDPLDAWLDNSAILVNPAYLTVDVVDPDVININWFVNGTLVPGANDETFRLSEFGFGAGRYTITARAFDANPDWVRMNLDQLQESISWNVTSTAIPEPTTLVLLGTTAGGLALARLSRCGRKQQQPGSGPVGPEGDL